MLCHISEPQVELVDTDGQQQYNGGQSYNVSHQGGHWGGQSYSGVSHTVLGIGVDREKRITTCSLYFPGSVQKRVGSETHRETNIQTFKS